MPTVGVLALQGDFREHARMLTSLGAEAREVRRPEQLAGLDGLIIPGGESTAISKLAVSIGLLEPLKAFGQTTPIWGTCAGAIFLSPDATGEPPRLGLMDIEIDRNAFGRQVDSFELDMAVPMLDEPERPYHAVFIRAPWISRVGPAARALLTLPDDLPKGAGKIVAARQGHLLATSFHPELTDDTRFHACFLKIITGR